MTATQRITALRMICWLGVAADAIWTVALLHPPLFGLLTGRAGFSPDFTLRLNMGIGASLMAGWTLLLAWTSHDPIARRAVFLLTACPVVLGLAIVSALSVADNGAGAWILVKLALLGTAMLTGFFLAKSSSLAITPRELR
jgi:hypothetical protein